MNYNFDQRNPSTTTAEDSASPAELVDRIVANELEILDLMEMVRSIVSKSLR